MNHKVPVHGNYHGYYSKRPSALSDTRLHQLPPNIFLNARVLDVGCNEGWITCEIAQTCGAQKVVGVDIDESLVEGAWRRRRALWSAQGPDTLPPPPPGSDSSAEEPSERPRKRRKGVNSSSDSPEAPEGQGAPASGQLKKNYFPSSCEHEFGSLPIPPVSGARGKTSFPHNVSFRCADWVSTDILEDTLGGYDVVVAFSISKWIHLNNLDSGLISFFRKVYRVLRKGGTFIFEPQPWESYSKARRMSEELKENYKKLELRPEGFEDILKEIGFGPPTHLGSLGEGGFARPVDLYVKL